MTLDDTPKSPPAGPEPLASSPPLLTAFRRQFGPAFRALRHRNYRLFFAGQGMSLVGTWMQRTTLAYLIVVLYESDKTAAALMLGVVGFVGQIVTFLLAPLGGLVAEHAERRKLLLLTQALAMVQAFVLAVLVFTGVIATWQIILLSGMLGVINAFDIPIRQSFVVEMLESRDDLPKAIAMNSFMVNAARLVGPSVGGVLIAHVGYSAGFAINGLTFLAVIAALLAMRIKPVDRPERNGGILRNLREGIGYAVRFTPILAILMLLASMSLLGSANAVLMPVFAKEIFAGGDEKLGAMLLGFMMAASAIGAMVGAVFLATRPSVRGMGRIMAVACALLGGSAIIFGLSHSLVLSYCMLGLTGFGMMVQFSGSNSLLQTLVDDDKRGRVMSLYVMAFMGMGPFGSLLGGLLGGHFGVRTTVVLAGVGCVVAGGLFATRLPMLGQLAHPVYVRMGIVADPEEIARL